MSVSVVIPFYNEGAILEKCLASLARQTRPFELVLVNDGSTDGYRPDMNILNSQGPHSNFRGALRFLEQSHLGPAAARNLGARQARGEILVFVDADMEFAEDFLENLIAPIEAGQSRGTFTVNEQVENWDNAWARMWNYNQGLYGRRRLAADYPEEAPVFRAILKSEFMRVGGFTAGVGWTDDWTLSRKLGYRSTKTAAACFHHNPGSLSEAYVQAVWIGKNEFISGSWPRAFFNLCRYSLPLSVTRGLISAFRWRNWRAFMFCIVYDAAVSRGIRLRLTGASANK